MAWPGASEFGGQPQVRRMLQYHGHTSAVIALAFSPDSTRLGSLGRDGTFIEFDPFGGIAHQSAHPQQASAMAYTTDGDWMIGRAGGIERANLAPISAAFGPSVTVLAILDPKTLVTGWGDRLRGSSGHLVLYDLNRGQFRTPRFSEPAGVRSLAVHPASRTIAWANGSRRISLWTITRPDQTHLNLSHSSPSIAFHPDGGSLAAALDYSIRVFDFTTRREPRLFQGHRGPVMAVAITPDGRSLISGSWDETVRVWDYASGEPREEVRWPTGKVRCLAVSPDGSRVAAAGQSGSVVVWDRE